MATQLDFLAAQYVAKGWRVESQTDTAVMLVRGHRTSHVLHLLLSIITFGLWLPIWALVALATGERRKLITLDDARRVDAYR